MIKKINNKWRAIIVSIIVTAIVTAVIGSLGIWLLGAYGWTVFVLAPLLLGFLPPYILGKTQKLTKKQSFGISFAAYGVVTLGLLILAIEGLICIAMAFPITSILTLIGSYLGYKIRMKNWLSKGSVNLLIILSLFSSMSFDYIYEADQLLAVRTKVVVNSPIDKVWEHVVTFDQIPEPKDWIFKTGIAYPTDATIDGYGVGAIRYCNFSTGSFVEPITTWDEPNLLQFDVLEQPIPMNEMNPFWDVHPPHLEGYFISKKGQFKLTILNENQTELEGTTWYKIGIHPQQYWRKWSDAIIHRIHKRVLIHIKQLAEK